MRYTCYYGIIHFPNAVYKGYINQDNQKQGPGRTIFKNGYKEIGDYNGGKLQGSASIEFENGDKFWGEFNDSKKEGFGTQQFKDGSKYLG